MVFSEPGCRAPPRSPRRIGFPLAVLAYALLNELDPAPPESRGGTGSAILWSVLASLGVVVALTWVSVAADDALPGFMADRLRDTAAWAYALPARRLVPEQPLGTGDQDRARLSVRGVEADQLSPK